MSTPQAEIEPLCPALGAVLHNIDLSRTLPEEQVDVVQQALLEHQVVFFRDQSLGPEDLSRLANQFGSPTVYPFVEGLDDHPDVIEVLKLPDEKHNFGGVWHADTTYLPEPAMGAILYADIIPKTGGDTLFSNMCLAYESLSTAMQEMLSKLRAVNDADKPAIANTRYHRLGANKPKNLKATHPVVRTHPETGRKLLFVSRAHTTHFEGWSAAESRSLLTYLFDVQNRAEFTFRWQWQPGSVAFWDNRACQHYPLNDYHGQKRRMLRISLKGDRPF